MKLEQYNNYAILHPDKTLLTVGSVAAPLHYTSNRASKQRLIDNSNEYISRGCTFIGVVVHPQEGYVTIAGKDVPTLERLEQDIQYVMDLKGWSSFDWFPVQIERARGDLD